MTLTVRDVLGLEAMRGAHLLAGASGLTRPVRSATVMDAPDGALWFKTDEIAFTSTYPLITLRDRLEPFITDLAERGIAGLGVKLTRYMTEIPAPVLATADRLGFPIISLPEKVSWIELINPIVTNASAAQADRLRRRTTISDGFAESLLGSANLGDLARLLSEMVENPVLIDCEAEGITTWSHDLGAERSTETLSRLREGTKGAKRVNEKHPVFRVEGRGSPLIYVPLADEIGVDGLITVIEETRAFDANDLDCLLQAQQACSIKMMQLLNDMRARRERESTFVSSLIEPHSNIAARQKLLRSGAQAGYHLQGPHMVVVCRTGGVAGRQLEAVKKAIHVRMSARGDVLTGFLDPGLTVLVFNSADRLERGSIGYLLRELHGELAKDFPRLRFVAGISHRLLDFYSLPNGFAQAEQARVFHGEAPDSCTIRRIDEIGLLRLFGDDRIQPEAKRFVDDWLGALIDHDRRRASRLVATLRAFLEANGNHREAAKRLNLHHNSVRYRIAKISKLTGHDVVAPGIKLQYELALALRNVFERPSL
ncbi:MAG: PucR family transcriptional regulator ligand-binding domain-containing protein [Roseovarius sp.]